MKAAYPGGRDPPRTNEMQSLKWVISYTWSKIKHIHSALAECSLFTLYLPYMADSFLHRSFFQQIENMGHLHLVSDPCNHREVKENISE